MEIEVVLPVPLPSSPEFSFDSATSTPYITAPSSPQRFGTYYAPPSSNTAVDLPRTSFSINPALWEEENPGISGKNPKNSPDFIELEDFEFEFDGLNSTLFESSPALADELFDRGRIKPMKMIINPTVPEQGNNVNAEPPIPSSATSTSIKRVCDILNEDDEAEEEEEDERQNQNSSPASSTQTSSSRTFSSILSSIAIPKNYRKWSFRDFLLFRSASEGRGMSSDPLRKFPTLGGGKIGRSESFGESTKGLSLRTPASAAREESSGGRRQQRSRGGAHEAYYSANKAAAEEMKRRTALPYKQGLLGGCLGFNPSPGAAHDLARSCGSLHYSRDQH